jgi:hypothetical protein
MIRGGSQIYPHPEVFQRYEKLFSSLYLPLLSSSRSLSVSLAGLGIWLTAPESPGLCLRPSSYVHSIFARQSSFWSMARLTLHSS